MSLSSDDDYFTSSGSTKNPKTIQIKNVVDVRGTLGIIETNHQVPFEIKRVFFLSKLNPSLNRGGHAHKKVEQFIFCPSGSVDVLCENANGYFEYKLESSDIGLWIPTYTWCTLKNFNDSGVVIVVCASDYYDENEYIRNYAEFNAIIGKIK